MHKTILNVQNIPLLLLLIFNLVIGAVYIEDYGLSWDEPSRFQVAERSLATYLGAAKEPSGKLYLAISKMGANTVNAIFKNWDSVESWHYFNFMYFQLSLIFFYMICLRFFDRWVSFATTLLYASQPLLWGHAFINPKDIPFTMYFLGGLAFGLRVIEAVTKHQVGNKPLIYPRQILSVYRDNANQEWSTINDRRKKIIRKAALLSFGVLVLSIVLTPVVGWVIKFFITQAAQGNSADLISQWITQMAENIHDIPAELYAQKGVKIYLRLVGWYGITVLLFNIILAVFVFPRTLRQLFKNEIMPLIQDGLRFLKNANVWVAGVFIGMATSVRVLGPAAWLLLLGYLTLKFRRKAFPSALAMLIVSLIALILAWPSMWISPLEALHNTATKAANFPWESTVMFSGIEYPANQLPRTYMPVLLSLQLTEPVLLLFLGGLGLALAGLKNHRHEWQATAFFAAWFFIPLIGVVIVQPTMYDNFRHFTFILPALFLFCGICLKTLFRLFRIDILRIALLFLCLLPSIYWNIGLHPYQYVYYNSLTGGVRGAFRNYELDYWATSYREAAQYINEIAPRNARVMVWGPARLGMYYCRPDIEIQRSLEHWDEDESDTPIYAIISTRHNKDQQISPDSPELFWVERDGARLVVVKQIPH
ncbi:MAG: hypothetical protein JW908_02300 [Anaerolineales bacterium]|nr:hypothetical protein [Anaerolineales bacterium]